jgi:hypothetical protein
LHESNRINHEIPQFLCVCLPSGMPIPWGVPCNEQAQLRHHIQTLRIVCDDL